MDPAGWQRAKEILADALQRPSEERDRFLADACPDAELRGEIEALLESYAVVDGLESIAGDDEDQPQSTSLRSARVERASAWQARNTRSDSLEKNSAGSASSAVAFEFPSGYQAGPYEFVAPLGKGGGGEVYRARDTRLQRDVAIKVLPRTTDAEGTHRVREARAAAQLNHRGVASIHDIFHIDAAGSRPCIVMEYVAGRTLADRLRERRLDAAGVVDLGLEITDAVAHAHAAGILHCDLKPGNIRFAADGSAKILDFGLARRAPGQPRDGAGVITGLSASSLRGLALGTPGYMSPEQLLGLPLDIRTDVYSLGVILFEMAAGARPFEAGDLMSTAVAVLSTPLPELPRDVPRPLRGVIVKCLSRTPDDRYASAAALHEALADVRKPAWRRLLSRLS